MLYFHYVLFTYARNLMFSLANLFFALSQVLEDNKQWWKLLNRSGQAGYVPYNILDVVKLEELEQVCRQVTFNWEPATGNNQPPRVIL